MTDRPTKVYIATSMSNHAAHNAVRDALVATGMYELTYDWTVHGPVWASGVDRVREVADCELRGIVWDAQLVIVLLPGGRGTHVELGAALAMASDVEIVIVSADPAAFEIGPDTCAFHHHPSVIQLVADPCAADFVDRLHEALLERGVSWR